MRLSSFLRRLSHNILVVIVLANLILYHVNGSENLQYDSHEDLIKKVKESGTLPPYHNVSPKLILKFRATEEEFINYFLGSPPSVMYFVYFLKIFQLLDLKNLSVPILW